VHLAGDIAFTQGKPGFALPPLFLVLMIHQLAVSIAGSRIFQSIIQVVLFFPI
jgi:hypothetical protein